MIDNSQTPKISFCITCKNRLYQIKKTLPQNLEDNRRLQENSRICARRFRKYGRTS